MLALKISMKRNDSSKRKTAQVQRNMHHGINLFLHLVASSCFQKM